MNEWIRPLGSSEPWHFERVVTASGSRMGYCGIWSYFEPGDELETRPFEDPPPVEDRCLWCDDAYYKVPRIPPRRHLAPARSVSRGTSVADPPAAGVPELRR
jgi:hypothetical protein